MKNTDAIINSKNSFHYRRVILSNKELDASIENTSRVRYVCPKTGEEIEKPELPFDVRLKHLILNYKGKVPFCLSIKYQCKRKGFSKLSQAQKDGFLGFTCIDSSNLITGKL